VDPLAIDLVITAYAERCTVCRLAHRFEKWQQAS
jgi:hypothetical protein